MENDIRALIDKLKANVTDLANLRTAAATIPNVYLLTLDGHIARAEAKVAATEATLLAVVRTVERK